MRTHISYPHVLAVTVIALLIDVFAASAITFTNDTLVSAGNTNSNFDGQDIVITNCTVTVDGAHTFASLRILNSGILTHSFDTNALVMITGINLTITNSFEIEMGGAVDVSGKGYAGGFGLGAGASRSTSSPFLYSAGAGGGHGGFGGSSSTLAPGGTAYGAIPTPTEKGSGGGAGAGAGGAGGGAIKIIAGGPLRVDGRIAADGSDGLHPYSGGGAGGSVWLIAQTITGKGAISANGGAGEPNDGGGGGGGRIAIYVSGAISASTNQFGGSISARGGSGAMGGGAGTIYLRGSSDAVAQLLIDNGGSQGTNTPLSSFDLADLTISGGALVQSGSTPPIHNLVIHSNSWLIQAPRQILDLSITANALIEPEAGISGDGGGFPTGQGPGHGGSTLSFPLGTWGGGGYGGYGGSSLSNAPGGLAYGSSIEPTDFGSGGGAAESSLGGTGGGMVRLRVQGQLDVRGKISVNGADGIGTGSGGGSGGSLVISAGVLSGSGSLLANGGAGESSYGGGGGGGRMQLQLGTNLFGGLLSARGGPGAHYGGAGTVYLRAQQNPFAQVVVDNGGMLGSNTLVSGTSAQVDLEAPLEPIPSLAKSHLAAI